MNELLRRLKRIEKMPVRNIGRAQLFALTLALKVLVCKAPPTKYEEEQDWYERLRHVEDLLNEELIFQTTNKETPRGKRT